MSEELIQKDLIKNPEKIGKWNFYNIGATTVKQLKENGIIRNVDYRREEKKKIDGLIVLNKNVIAVIEYKSPTNFNTKAKKSKAIKQELNVARKLKAKVLIATDTKESLWINVATGNLIKNEDNCYVQTNFDPKSDKTPQFIEKIINSINEKNDVIKPINLVNPTGLAKQIWQDIWSVSGATPENCLYTFVELFIFKYLSDLQVLRGLHSFDSLMIMYNENSDDEVLQYYADVIRKKIKELFPRNEIDKTTIINGTIFVSKDQKAVEGYSTVFKKVLLKFKDYGKLEHIDYDFKSQLFESFLKESISKKNWGQFFTPLKVVRAIVEMAKDDIKPGVSICDPACGVGKFLLEPIKTKLDQFYKIVKNKIIPQITIHGFDKGFDKDEQKTIIMAKANMLIYFSDLIKENPGITKEFANLFNNCLILKTNSILGSLSEPIEDKYDLILTNPPYVTSGSSNLKEEIKKDGDLVNYYKINGMGVEGLFMEWIIKALKPGGKAFVIIPDGILNRQNDKNIRKYILDECFLDAIISLPLNTFFTTNKKTYILVITKKHNKFKTQVEPIFTYLASEIGETRDVYRFDMEQDDLREAVTLFSFFKGNKSNFGKINTDQRCKIQPIEKFINNIEDSWIIDKWWTEDEKIQLGIVEKQETVNLFEFSLFVEDIANSLTGLNEEIKELAEKKKSKSKFKSVQVKKLFNIKKGFAKYTKKYGNLNKGLYPVFSASNNKPLTFIKTYDYDGKFLTWATNGFAGYIKLIEGKFSINGDRGLLCSMNNAVDIDYVKIVLEPKLREMARGRRGEKGEDEFTKVYPSMLENLSIPLPYINDEIDILAQKEIIEKYYAVQEIKKQVNVYKEQIKKLNVEIKGEYNFCFLKIKDIFDLNAKTNSSKFTKTFINKHQGNIPVYSASKNPLSIEYGFVEDKLDGVKYFENCLTWNIDGSIGKAHFREGRFSLSEKVIPLILQDNMLNKTDYTYLKYTIESEFQKYSFGFGNKAGKGKIKNIPIPIPISKNNKIDLKLQQKIAHEYQKIEQLKSILSQELEKIEKISINFE